LLIDNYKIIDTMTLEIESDIICTGNQMYQISTRNGRPRLVKIDKVRAFQKDVVSQVDPLPSDLVDRVKCYVVTAHVYYYNWMTKANKLRRIDLTNVWKPLEDALCNGLGLDDSLCADQRQIKYNRDRDTRLLVSLDYTFYG